MPVIDWPIEQLRSYRPAIADASTIDRFWDDTLAEAQGTRLEIEMIPISYPVDGLTIQSIRYSGWHGARISGLYLAPEATGESVPALVFFHGYSGNKGHVHDYLAWAFMGYAVLAVDVRGQSGDTGDPGPYSTGRGAGWMTQGILSPQGYYYRAVYVDCVRALDAVAAQPCVDSNRIAVIGGSQGGGLALAVAALDNRPRLTIADVPFLCNFRRALEVTDAEPYREIARYCALYPEHAEHVFDTLDFVDNVNLAHRIRCPVLMTVGLQDAICPPSTVFGVFNSIVSAKHIEVFPYGGHEAFPTHHAEKLRWLRRYLWLGTPQDQYAINADHIKTAHQPDCR